MRKSLAIPALVLTGALALAGCTSNQGDLGNKSIRSQNVRQDGFRMNTTRFANDQAREMNRVDGRQFTGNNVTGLHGNTRLEMSQRIADQLRSMPGIRSAYVMLTDRNAYVAVVEKSRAGAPGTGVPGVGTRTPGTGRIGSAVPRTGMTGASTPNGTGYRPFGNMSGSALTGRSTGTYTGAGYNNGNVGTYFGSNYGNTGFYSGTGTTSADVSSALKDRIANQVKAMAPDIQNVYVSANPDFVSRMQNFANAVSQGHPIQGLVAEFNALVQRIFPTTGYGTGAPGTAPTGTAGTAGRTGMTGTTR